MKLYDLHTVTKRRFTEQRNRHAGFYSRISRRACLFLMLNQFLFLISTGTNPVKGDTLREKIGQMIIVGFDQNSSYMDTLWADIEQRNVGGVILYRRNLQNPEQIRELTRQLQSRAQTLLFIATDQEGGRVARFNSLNGFEGSYSHYELGTIFNAEDSTRKTAATMAHWLSSSGVNLNLAPVADVNVNPASPAIGFLNRSFSIDPMTVFQHAEWFIDEFKKQHIISTLKHFPGHGNAAGDSHLGFTNITATWSEAELIPYTELIRRNYSDMVMMGHLYHADFDSMHPASLSHRMTTDLLRRELGFQGTIISDAMFMRAITDHYAFDEAVELAIDAGIDILLYETNSVNDKSLARQLIDIVEQKVNAGLIAESRIDESYQRIMKLKGQMVGITDKNIQASMPDHFSIDTYPNPFHTKTNIIFTAERPTRANVSMVNITGQVVWSKADVSFSIGKYQFPVDANGLTSGIYFIRLQTPEAIISHKIMLIR